MGGFGIQTCVALSSSRYSEWFVTVARLKVVLTGLEPRCWRMRRDRRSVLCVQERGRNSMGSSGTGRMGDTRGLTVDSGTILPTMLPLLPPSPPPKRLRFIRSPMLPAGLWGAEPGTPEQLTRNLAMAGDNLSRSDMLERRRKYRRELGRPSCGVDACGGGVGGGPWDDLRADMPAFSGNNSASWVERSSSSMASPECVRCD